MLAMGRAMHNESPRFARHTFDPEKSLRVLTAMQDAPSCLLLVVEADGALVGMLLGLVSEHHFCNGLVANELVVYVTPGARGGSAAVKMLRQFEAWAQGQGVDEIVLGVSTEVAADRTADFYQRMGYAHSGHTLIKRVCITH
jgi:GNAT superfamily N-acetyltransferase